MALIFEKQQSKQTTTRKTHNLQVHKGWPNIHHPTWLCEKQSCQINIFYFLNKRHKGIIVGLIVYMIIANPMQNCNLQEIQLSARLCLTY